MLRIARRKAALEDDFETFFETEFMRQGAPDLTPSVYDVRGELEQMHSEHAAGCGLKPPRYFGHIDLSDALPRAPIKEPGTGPFRFTREAHYYFDARDSAELKNVAKKIHDAGPPFRIDVSRKGVANYVRQRLVARDPEWTGFCADDTQWTAFANSSP